MVSENESNRADEVERATTAQFADAVEPGEVQPWEQLGAGRTCRAGSRAAARAGARLNLCYPVRFGRSNQTVKGESGNGSDDREERDVHVLRVRLR